MATNTVVSSPSIAVTRSSPILVRKETDGTDDYESYLTDCFAQISSILSERDDVAIHQLLLDKVSEGPEPYSVAVHGLLHAILASDPLRASRYFGTLAVINRDSYATFIKSLLKVIQEKWKRLSGNAHSQVLWVTNQMISAAPSSGADKVCSCLIKQITVGDFNGITLWLAQQLIKIFSSNMEWTFSSLDLLPLAVFTFLRLIPIHSTNAKCQELCREEVGFCYKALTEKTAECKTAGRDLVRLLRDVMYIPPLEGMWHSALIDPAHLLTVRTPDRFHGCLLSSEMELHLNFLLQNVKFGGQARYQAWFAARYFYSEHCEWLIPDLVRYIVCTVQQPAGEETLVPRWAVISWLIESCKAVPLAKNSAMLSLFYDWLYFTEGTDRAINIEPAMDVLVNNLSRYPKLVNNFLHFFFSLIDNFDEASRPAVVRSVQRAMKLISSRKATSAGLHAIAASHTVHQPYRERLAQMFLHTASRTPNPSAPAPAPQLQPQKQLDQASGRSAAGRGQEVAESAASDLNVSLALLAQAATEAEVLDGVKKTVRAYTHLDAGSEGQSSSHGRSAEEVCQKIVEACERAGHALCCPLRPNSKEDEASSLTATVMRLFVSSARKTQFLTLLLTWHSMGRPVGPRLLCYATLLAEEEDLKGGGDVGVIMDQVMVMVNGARLAGRVEGNGKETRKGPEVVRHAFLAYCQFTAQLARRKDAAMDTASSSSAPLVKEILAADMGTCLLWDSTRLLKIVPAALKYLPHLCVCDDRVLELFLSISDPASVRRAEKQIAAGHFSVVGASIEDLDALLATSLSWEAIEQQWLWTLIAAESSHWSEDFLLAAVSSCLKLPSQDEDGAAISGALTVLRLRVPSENLLRKVLHLEAGKESLGIVVLSSWFFSHYDALYHLFVKRPREDGALIGRFIRFLGKLLNRETAAGSQLPHRCTKMLLAISPGQ